MQLQWHLALAGLALARAKSVKRPARARPRTGAPRRASAPGQSATALASTLGVTREAIRLWTLDGCPRRDNGTYLVAEVVTWLRKRDRETASREHAPDEAKERARKLRAEADLKELELQERRGQLVTHALFQERLDGIVGGFAAVAAGQLARFERPIVAAQTVGDARRITEGIHRALMQGARDFGGQLEADAEDAAENAA